VYTRQLKRIVFNTTFLSIPCYTWDNIITVQCADVNNTNTLVTAFVLPLLASAVEAVRTAAD